MSNREWTVMVYFAADNDLSPFAVKNLSQMLTIGATDKVHLLAQVDLFDPTSPTRRFTMKETGGWTEEKIGETNTGAIEAFVKFIEWGTSEEHKAERYLIVIWAHANGVFDSPENEKDLVINPLVDQPVVPPGINMNVALPQTLTAIETIGPLAHLESVSSTLLDIGVDHHTAAAAKPEKVFGESAGDVTSSDALTTRELGVALAEAKKKLGKNIAIFGVDACLMSMVEVAQQISGSANLMVASQQTIPDTSWPYDAILRKLVAEPTIDEGGLATVIVEEYIKAYQSQASQQVTLSVCNLEKTDVLVNAISNLRKAIAALLPVKDLRDALVRARDGSLSFVIQDFVDLFDFCRVLLETLDQDRLKSACASSGQACENARKACNEVRNIISQADKSGFVIATGNNSAPGGLLERAKGVSLYFPRIAPLYKNLLFCSKTEWNKFLSDYARALLSEDGAGDSFNVATSGPVSGNGH